MMVKMLWNVMCVECCMMVFFVVILKIKFFVIRFFSFW